MITSLSFDQGPQAVGLGFINSGTSTGFDAQTTTLAASSLQAAVTQDGQRGRVVTAISYDGTQATYYSYGWIDDPSSVYESEVVFATLATAADQTVALAADGYILTASGSTQAESGSAVVLVGTRVQGDTMSRPVLVGDAVAGTVGPLLQGGYAVVAIISQGADNIFVGER